MAACRRDELEKNTGVKDLQRGVLQSRELREWLRPSATTFDVLHCFYSNGIVSLEVKLFLDRLANSGCSRERIQDWFQDQSLESYRNDSKKLDVRCLGRAFFGDVWKADASTQLSFMPLWQYFAVQYRDDGAQDCAQELRCLESLGCRTTLLEMLRWTKQAHLLQHLEAAQRNHHRLFCEVYPGLVRPKHHYSLKQGGKTFP